MNDTTVVFIHPSDELYGADRCLLAMVRGRPPETDAVVVLPRDVEYGGALDFVGMIERQENAATVDTLEALAKALDVHAAQLIEQ